jgi:magnesium-transporting ATPase (P-type)
MTELTDSRKQKYLPWIAALLAALAALAGVILVVVRWRKRRTEKLAQEALTELPSLPARIQGLTEAEADARLLEGQDNAIQFSPPRTRRDIVRDNVLTIFNLSLVGLVTVQLLLQRPLDALISFGVMCLNIGVNIAQEFLARRMLRDVEEAGRPQATVIREGVARSIDSSKIVLGDALVVGPGDPLFVDGELVDEGQIVVDESMLTSEGNHRTVVAGDEVYAGSLCISGRSVYQARKVGDSRLIASLTDTSERAKKVLTPLEQVINRVLRLLLMIVAAFTAALLIVYYGWDTGISTEQFNSVASVIFSIAPAGLFFMIFLNYTMGTANLGRLGALVHQSRSVELLAQADTMCFAQAGILTGTHVELETIDSPGEEERLAESRIRQILGDYARTTSVKNLATRAMETSFEGDWRAAIEEAPFLSLYGWSAISYDDDDLRGVYVLADPVILEAHLATEGHEPAEDEASRVPAAVRRAFSPLGRLFGRSAQTSEENGAEAAPHQDKTEPVAPSQSNKDTPPEEKDDAPRSSIFRRFVKRVNRTLRREKDTPDTREAADDPRIQETTLQFAYRPDILPLHAADASPQLPSGMIPLCYLRYSERVRPETIETMRTFMETGVGVKIFSSQAPDRTVSLLRKAGVTVHNGSSLGTISGFELAGMDPAQLGQAAEETTIFGHLAPEHASQVVEALRGIRHSVAAVGDGVNDVPAMQQANLAIARRSSTQAALSLADILLLEDSPQVLQRVLDRGQRIVNGLLDVLKISLTQVFNVALLIVIIQIFSAGFPYQAKQGSFVNLITVVLPSVGLSLFAAAGVLSTSKFGRLLARFVGPASATMSATALVVYLIFLDRTGDYAYTQLALTYTLVVCGLLLVVFARPPIVLRKGGGGVQSDDWRPTAMVLFLLLAFLLLAPLPIMNTLFELDGLQDRSHYLVIGLAALVWAITLRIVWWVIPVIPKVPIAGTWLDKSPDEGT